MNLNFWQVDAFTKTPFKGNPAAVFVLKSPLSDDIMQNIAIEMNLSEIAFILKREGKKPLLRWFTPSYEIDLCGHATLAAAHIYLTKVEPNLKSITFDTKFVPPLTVEIAENLIDTYQMKFPIHNGKNLITSAVPQFVLEAIHPTERPYAAYETHNLVLIYKNEDIIHTIAPNFNALRDYNRSIIITAKSQNPAYDFISRYFCADDTIPEDPVTGSAHCTLTPYWAKKLGKNILKAYQASARGGELELELTPQHTLIKGQAITIIEGKVRL